MAVLSNSTNTCKACKQELPIDMFYRCKHRSGRYYASNDCKGCTGTKTLANKANAVSDPSEAERRKLWRREHKRKVRAAQGCRTREQIALDAMARASIEKAPKPKQCDAHIKRFRSVLKSRAKSKAYYEAKRNDPAYKARVQAQRRANPNIKKYMRGYLKTPAMRLHHRMSKNIRESLNGTKARRSWQCLVGYTKEELRLHLERQFTDGMSWSNMSEWHIDHITPRAALKYTSSNDPNFKACWAISNLRPLWGGDNIKKGSGIEYLL